MSLNIPLPANIKEGIVKRTIGEVIRRGIDGTSLPIFIDNNNRVNIGSQSGAIHNFYLSIVSDFSKQANFLDNVTVQRNISVNGDGVVSGLLQAGRMLTLGLNIGSSGITFQDGTSLSTAVGFPLKAINQFFINLVAGFNKKVIFYDQVVHQGSVCIAGDLVVSGTLQASVIICKKLVVSEIIEP